MRRVPLLIRLSRRYAVRHKAQTLRAILGLLVATTVLVAGLGMGESIAVSLERAALARLGPVDVTVSSQQPFDAGLADRLTRDPAVAPHGAAGAATLAVTGAALHREKGRAEAFATIRGVSPEEHATLGPLPSGPNGPVAEPGPGEVVLSTSLARSLDARIGDRVALRAQPPGMPDVDVQPVTLVGVGGVPDAVAQAHTLTVGREALGLGAQIAWSGNVGEVTLEAIPPSGVARANQSATSPLELVVPGPLEPGNWTIRVRAAQPVVYQGGAAVAYLPGAALSNVVTIEARVSGISSEEGRAGITGRPTALVQLSALQTALDQRGNATHIYMRVAGDPYAVVAAIEAQIGTERYQSRADKAELLADAAEAGGDITGFLLVMGGFTLLAAVLLAFTLFSALVEERRAELGIARALGLTRGEVAFAMTIEGALYAVFAAVAGLALGVLMLLGILAGIRFFARGENVPLFELHLSPATIVTAFLIGTLLPLATIGLASLRFARLDPARAIRGIPDDPKERRRFGRWAGGGLVVVGGAFAFGPVSHLIGIPLALAGVTVLVFAWGRPRLALLPAAAAVAHIVWTLYTFTAFPESIDGLDPILTLSRGAILALGFSALAVVSARPYQRVAQLLSTSRAKRASFLAFKYIVARRRPTGLTMAMISIVVVVVTVMGTLFGVFGANFQGHEAGYAVLGESPLPVDGFPRPLPADLSAAIARADFIPSHVEFRQANVTRDGQPVGIFAGMRQFLGVTPDFGENNEYPLVDRIPQYATDRDAWRAVARGEAMLPPDWMLQRNDIAPGDTLTVETAIGGPRTYVVAGGVDSQFVFQTFVPADHVQAMGFPTTARIWVRVSDAGDANDVAHRLSGIYAEDGLSFTSIPEEVARFNQAAQALVLVFESFLALGLFVGLAATGFLASRAVHERMRDIGTLRALGYEEQDVRLAFILESTATAAVGLLIGTLSGLLVAHSIWAREVRGDGVPFRPPVVLLVVFAIAVLGLAAWASSGPAKRAARLAPAIAVRHVE